MKKALKQFCSIITTVSLLLGSFSIIVAENTWPSVPEKYLKDYSESYNFSSLAELQMTDMPQIIEIPAMPQYGFNFPYLIRIPSNKFQMQNEDVKKYAVVQVYNTSTVNTSLSQALTEAKNEMKGDLGAKVAENLCVPEIKPVIPRTGISYKTESGETHSIHNVAINSDIINMPLIKQDNPGLYSKISAKSNEKGWSLEDFMYHDYQVQNMIRHCIFYLNSNGFKLENKVFMTGFSASGRFANRFTALHNDMVKAEASGVVGTQAILPYMTLGEENLVYPLGIYDYKNITGKEYSITDANKVAHLYFDGSNDTNNDLDTQVMYMKNESSIIKKFFGETNIERANKMQEYLFKTSQNGMFICDMGVGHAYSQDMSQFVIDFFKANRQDEAIYLIPANPSQLKYAISKGAKTTNQPVSPKY